MNRERATEGKLQDKRGSCCRSGGPLSGEGKGEREGKGGGWRSRLAGGKGGLGAGSTLVARDAVLKKQTTSTLACRPARWRKDQKKFCM